MITSDIMDIIYLALQAYLKRNKKSRIKEISFDGDNKSCSLIVVIEENGKHMEYVLSSEDIRPLH